MPSPTAIIEKFKQLSNPNIQRFPTQIFETGPDKYMKFTPVFKEKAFFKKPENDRAAQSAVILPIPANLQDNSSYSFSEAELGFLAGPLDATLQKAFGELNVSGAVDQLKSDGANATNNVVTSMLLNLSNRVTGAGNTFTSVYLGAANPYLKNVFTGVGFKRHTFAFQMVARNANDSAAIQNIIRTFRIFSAPRGKGTPILDVQYEWKVQFSDDVARWMYPIQNAYLANISTAYNTQNVSAFHTNSAPLDVTLVLEFVENEIATAEVYENNMPVVYPDGSFDYLFAGTDINTVKVTEGLKTIQKTASNFLG